MRGEERRGEERAFKILGEERKRNSVRDEGLISVLLSLRFLCFYPRSRASPASSFETFNQRWSGRPRRPDRRCGNGRCGCCGCRRLCLLASLLRLPSPRFSIRPTDLYSNFSFPKLPFQ
jgi:hypothetical protein